MLLLRSSLVLRKRRRSSSSVSLSLPGEAAKGFVILSQPRTGVTIVLIVLASCSIAPASTACRSPTFRTLLIARLLVTENVLVWNTSALLTTNVLPTTEAISSG